MASNNIKTAPEYTKQFSPSFVVTNLVVLVMFVLYPFAGSILMALVAPGQVAAGRAGWMNDDLIMRVRAVQVAGQVLVLVLPVLFLVRFQTGSRALLSRENRVFIGITSSFNIRAVLLALAAVVLIQPFLLTMMELLSMALASMGEEGRKLLEEQQQLEAFLLYLTSWNNPFEFLLVLCVIAIVPAFCEEFFFRGYIQNSYVTALSPFRGILLTGIVFGLFHMSLFNLLPLMLMGWFLGYVYYRTASLWVPAAVHFANNALSLFMLQFQRQMPVSERSVGFFLLGSWSWWLVVVASLMLLLIVARRFHSLTAGAGDVVFQEG
ncbi:hypothetical protein CR161_12185 [Prosthecochloris sp. ZM]|uniref:CPBP family intramembrane glutamic endopeptidase n=1 Tax=Prosthecochloris sp. ZM TaxID=2283143 RepID=UPI000DF7FB45|nr:CPBP family intramembrane glutamic endopeptidase [Prosthecochloris sp. ZM]RDD31391.1 hypothetical protein CR161_12185 [Prosthecochloris sp. ZM]